MHQVQILKEVDGWELQKQLKAIIIFNTTKSSTLILPFELLYEANVLLSSVSFCYVLFRSVIFCFVLLCSVLIITVNITLISSDRLELSVSVFCRYGHFGMACHKTIQVLVRQGSKKFQSACHTQTTQSPPTLQGSHECDRSYRHVGVYLGPLNKNVTMVEL